MYFTGLAARSGPHKTVVMLLIFVSEAHNVVWCHETDTTVFFSLHDKLVYENLQMIKLSLLYSKSERIGQKRDHILCPYPVFLPSACISVSFLSAPCEPSVASGLVHTCSLSLHVPGMHRQRRRFLLTSLLWLCMHCFVMYVCVFVRYFNCVRYLDILWGFILARFMLLAKRIWERCDICLFWTQQNRHS